jgi:hypothetical protein
MIRKISLEKRKIGAFCGRMGIRRNSFFRIALGKSTYKNATNSSSSVTRAVTPWPPLSLRVDVIFANDFDFCEILHKDSLVFTFNFGGHGVTALPKGLRCSTKRFPPFMSSSELPP